MDSFVSSLGVLLPVKLGQKDNPSQMSGIFRKALYAAAEKETMGLEYAGLIPSLHRF